MWPALAFGSTYHQSVRTVDESVSSVGDGLRLVHYSEGQVAPSSPVTPSSLVDPSHGSPVAPGSSVVSDSPVAPSSFISSCSSIALRLCSTVSSRSVDERLDVVDGA